MNNNFFSSLCSHISKSASLVIKTFVDTHVHALSNMGGNARPLFDLPSELVNWRDIAEIGVSETQSPQKFG